MHEIAEILRSEREALGLTLDDLFQRTRINLDFLTAIEAGRFDVLPEAYVRLFIKKYAQEVGLNAPEILSQYDLMTPRVEPPEPPPKKREANRQPLLLFGAGICVVILLVWQIRQNTEPGTTAPLDGTFPAESKSQPDDLDTAISRTDLAPIVPDDLDKQARPAVLDAFPKPTRVKPVEVTVDPGSHEGTPLPGPVGSTKPLENTRAEIGAEPPAEPLPVVAGDTLPSAEPNAEPNADPARPQPGTLLAQTDPAPERSGQSLIAQFPMPVNIAPGNPIILSAIIKETTRLLVQLDGRILFDGDLQAGSRPRWAARDSVELSWTHAENISLFVQNEPLQIEASPNQPIRVIINRSQIRISPANPE
ncbi:MAG: helix-turn-helix domain-containing protein [bacterium]|nr:helix-turn-helix domain-containing protein [bacterium]